MKIGIDTQSASGKATGIGYYTRSLINEYKSFDGLSLFCYKNSSCAELNTGKRLLWENVSLMSMAKRDKIDILHVPGFAGPKRKGVFKKVTTVHDLIGMIYPRNLGCVSRFYWQKWLPACVKDSDHIIADSENTKNDILRLLRVPEEKVSVIYLAVDSRFKKLEKTPAHKLLLKKYDINNRYILNVGTVEPRKNIFNLIKAFKLFIGESHDKDMSLVIAGKKGWDYDRCLANARSLGVMDNMRFCDYVDDKDLPILYNNAEAFVYPSYYEGFGLPVLEALNCGVPVICSNKSSLPEVAGEAALYIEPDDMQSIKEMLLKSVYDNDTRQSLSEKALARVKDFSWKKTADRTIGLYRKVIDET